MAEELPRVREASWISFSACPKAGTKSGPDRIISTFNSPITRISNSFILTFLPELME
jgi:hypothetical protein